MLHRFIMPKLGWTMTHGKIVKWLKTEGQAVEKGEELLEIETDKVTIKVEAPESGMIAKILHMEGESVPVDHVVAVISSGDLKDEELSTFIEKIKATQAKMPVGASDDGARLGKPKGTGLPQATHHPGKILASPKARKLARDSGIDLARVNGTGPDGAITFNDVVVHRDRFGASGGLPIEQVNHDPRLTIESEVEISGIREVISSRMHSSLLSSAQLTITTDVSMGEASKFRSKVNEINARSGGPRVSYTDIIALVVSESVANNPKFRSYFDGKLHKVFSEVNIGIATATDRGLMVPVVWNASTCSLNKISSEIKQNAKAAREGTINPDKLSGGTFTITNLGMYGIDAFTPIINPPETAILGVGRMVTKPAYHGGSIVAVESMVFSLSFDHRLIDGHEAALFLSEIKELLQSRDALMDVHLQRERIEALEKFSQKVEGKADQGVLIIGGGPSANEACRLLAARGVDVAIIEMKHLGGTCLNEGCVPLKNLFEMASLMHQAKLKEEYGSGLVEGELELDYEALVSKKDEICTSMRDGMRRQLADAGITIIDGRASFSGDHEVMVVSEGGTPRKISFKKAIVATGSAYPPLLDTDGNTVIDAKQFFTTKEKPESIALVGKGKEALELASCMAGLGVEDVHVIIDGKVNMRGFDEMFTGAFVETLELKDIEIHENATAIKITPVDAEFEVSFNLAGGKEEHITVATVVNCQERVPAIEGLGLEKGGVQVDESGRIVLHDNATTNPDIFAIGDAANPPALMRTYVAARQGELVVDKLLGVKSSSNIDGSKVPEGYFSIPPVASVGLTMAQAGRQSIDARECIVPNSTLVGSHLVHEISGMVKLIYSKKNKKLLGAQIMGPLAHEIIATATIAVNAGLGVDAFLESMALHPTMSEAFKEAAFKILLDT